MTKINIKYMSDETLETLKANIDDYYKKFENDKTNGAWINTITNEKTFIEKKYQIEDFELKMPSSYKDRKTDFENSIILYESLKNLPKYVLSDERFWLWLMFEKAYDVSLALMENHDATAFRHQWLFVDGKRRGLFFGILSRAYYRVALTVDESLDDKYELTWFAIENPLRFREFTWRSISNHKHVVLGTLKAEKKVYEEYNFKEKGAYYQELAKDISKLGSVKLIDVMSENDLNEYIYDKYVTKLKGEGYKTKDDDYQNAIKMFETNDIKNMKESEKIFMSLDNYKDSLLKVEEVSNAIVKASEKKKGFLNIFKK